SNPSTLYIETPDPRRARRCSRSARDAASRAGVGLPHPRWSVLRLGSIIGEAPISVLPENRHVHSPSCREVFGFRALGKPPNSALISRNGSPRPTPPRLTHRSPSPRLGRPERPEARRPRQGHGTRPLRRRPASSGSPPRAHRALHHRARAHQAG